MLAAYRIGDSPVNTLTPLMVYFPFIVTVAQRYRKDAGVGTIVAMMLPYAVLMLIAWVVLFAIWYAAEHPARPWLFAPYVVLHFDQVHCHGSVASSVRFGRSPRGR